MNFIRQSKNFNWEHKIPKIPVTNGRLTMMKGDGRPVCYLKSFHSIYCLFIGSFSENYMWKCFLELVTVYDSYTKDIVVSKSEYQESGW